MDNGHMHPSFARVIAQKEHLKKKLSSIKHKIGIYSAKGGVGKTTTAVNIAYSLAKLGHSVGLLDADIDCPNVTMFLGMESAKLDSVQPMRPIVHQGVKVLSTAMVVDEMKMPMIWRGPIITKMVWELLANSEWGDLDYLVIDLPPGTSDSPLTIMQLLGLDGFVIVTTPQKISAVNSIRSGIMAKRLGAPILGVVENMSSGEISKHTKAVADELGTDVLGSVKRDDIFNSCSDSGKVAVLEDREAADAYLGIVQNLLG